MIVERDVIGEASPITLAVLTVEAFEGKEKASKLLCELIGELEKVFLQRQAEGTPT